jgi:hypothetical protein
MRAAAFEERPDHGFSGSDAAGQADQEHGEPGPAISSRRI